MKYIYNITIALIMLLSISCDGDPLPPISEVDTTENTDTDTTPAGWSLVSYSATNYPIDTDTWTIDDESADVETFLKLRDALFSAYDEGRKITLVANNLKSVPSYYAWSTKIGALSYCYALVSISFPQVTSIGGYAFQGCTNLTDCYLPKLESISEYSFSSCYALTKIDFPSITSMNYNSFIGCSDLIDISFATNSGVILANIGMSATNSSYNLFSQISESEITLTIGEANSAYISGNKITVGGSSATLKEIIIVDAKGDVVQ